MRPGPLPLLALLLGGCGGNEFSGTWLEGYGYSWAAANHRVNFIEAVLAEDSVSLATIGGTSTTGVDADLSDSCDPSSCDEIPFLDSSLVQVDWARATTTEAVFASSTVELVATADGAEASLNIPLPEKGKGAAAAVLSGLVVDTSYALSGGDACYNPAFGWLPRHLMVSLENPTLSDDGNSIDVTVKAAFEAGVTLEEIRLCLDEVVDQAQVPISVYVFGVATKGTIETAEVAGSAVYGFKDEDGHVYEQPDPDLSERPFSTTIEDPMSGWSKIDWRFHEEDPDDRGAYIRSISFGLSQAEGWASGHATNYSPLTQQSGFDYGFAGTVTSVDIGGGIERGQVSVELPAELDETTGAAVVSVEALGG